MLADSTKARVDSKKPRQEGLTYTIDKLEALDRENYEIISPLIDLVKIYGAFPLLIPDSILKKKIQFYHDQNILVSTGSSITEYAYTEGYFNKFVEEASKIGFDVIEIGENSIDLSIEQKEKSYHSFVATLSASRKIEFSFPISNYPNHLLMV